VIQLEPEDYPSIRIALGLAGDDAVSLPPGTIEALQYLPDVTARVNAAIEAADGGCFSSDPESDDYDEGRTMYAKVAIVLLTAAGIADEHRGAGADNRITGQSLGQLKVSYDKTDWTRVAADLERRGIIALARACAEAAGIYAGQLAAGGVPDLMVVDGPTRGKTPGELAGERDDVFAPWILGGP